MPEYIGTPTGTEPIKHLTTKKEKENKGSGSLPFFFPPSYVIIVWKQTWKHKGNCDECGISG
jgi:hypothetical protein